MLNNAIKIVSDNGDLYYMRMLCSTMMPADQFNIEMLRSDYEKSQKMKSYVLTTSFGTHEKDRNHVYSIVKKLLPKKEKL